MKNISVAHLPRVPSNPQPISFLQWASRFTNALRVFFQKLTDRVSAAPDWGGFVTPDQLSADQDDYAPADAEMLRLESAGGTIDITGFGNAGPGATRVIVNIGSADIRLMNKNGGSKAENRIITGTGAAVTIAQDEAVLLIYDDVSERWRLIG